MNYKKIYDQIIERAKNRILAPDIYVEKHHIIPKCLGGSNKKENLVNLTAREHFLAHWLLFRIYPENEKLFCAFDYMSKCKKSNINKNYKISSYLYAELREKHALFCKNKQQKFSKGRIFVFDFYTKFFLGEYKNTKEVKEKFNIGSGISNVLQHKWNHCNGYVFLRIKHNFQINIEEEKSKLVFFDSLQAKKNPRNRVSKIKVFKYLTNEFIGEYKNISIAAKELDIKSRPDISKFFKNECKYVNGYTFEKILTAA